MFCIAGHRVERSRKHKKSTDAIVKSDGTMTETGAQSRQSLLSFLTRNTTFLRLHFNDEYSMHGSDENDNDDASDTLINASVFMMLTSKFDFDILSAVQSEDYEKSGRNIALSLPFGDKPTFEKLMQWVMYGKGPSEFVDRQYCIEFARFYGIPVPFHEENSIIQEKINTYDDIPFLNEHSVDDNCPPPEEGIEEAFQSDGDDARSCDLSGEDVSFFCDRKLVVIGEKILRRRWKNRSKTGLYYYCLSPKCPGSVLISGNVVRVVRAHDSETCHVTKAMAIDLCVWEDIDSKIREIAALNPYLPSFDILTSFLSENENLADTLLTAPLAAILHYISGIREKNDVQLREILTAISEIADGSIIYQQVIPQRMLIYSSPKIRDFCDAKWLLIDGTFRRCPKQFYQCVTFLSREPQTGVFFPLCHCLLPNKCLETYELMFNVVETHLPLPNLEFVTVDFERALIKATKQWISRKKRPVHILGCKFHFSKCISKHFRKGIRKKRMTTLEKEFLGQCYGLPFLQKADIEQILKVLGTLDHPHETFIRYFKRTWMSDDMFSLWNISHREGDGLGSLYTNNGIESFHGTMSRQLSPHPGVQVFLRWIEAFSDECVRIIRATGAREWERSLDPQIRRIDILTRWTDLLQHYPTKALYQPLAFGFSCPHCGTVNPLAGRRRTHLFCANTSCLYYSHLIETDTVFKQVKDSLLSSLTVAIRAGFPRIQLCRALKNLDYWMGTLNSDNLREDEKTYIHQVCELCESLIGQLQY